MVENNEIKLEMNTKALDIAQEKADKLLKTLQQIHELIRSLKSMN